MNTKPLSLEVPIWGHNQGFAPMTREKRGTTLERWRFPCFLGLGWGVCPPLRPLGALARHDLGWLRGQSLQKLGFLWQIYGSALGTVVCSREQIQTLSSLCRADSVHMGPGLSLSLLICVHVLYRHRLRGLCWWPQDAWEPLVILGALKI